MTETRRAELHIQCTSSTCVRYTLLDDGRRVWSNRVHPVPGGDTGARERAQAWAARHGYVITYVMRDEDRKAS